MKPSTAWNRCTLVNLANPDHQVEAYFNPKEIGFDKKVPWNAHKPHKSDVPNLEYTNSGPKTLSFELFFDSYEDKLDVHEYHVQDLEALTLITPGTSGKDRHPPHVLVVWGNKSFLDFAGVITSLATKYTMFLPDGTPVRATCTVSLQEVARAKPQVTLKKGRRRAEQENRQTAAEERRAAADLE